jgi:hypothetical protein
MCEAALMRGIAVEQVKYINSIAALSLCSPSPLPQHYTGM